MHCLNALHPALTCDFKSIYVCTMDLRLINCPNMLLLPTLITSNHLSLLCFTVCPQMPLFCSSTAITIQWTIFPHQLPCLHHLLIQESYHTIIYRMRHRHLNLGWPQHLLMRAVMLNIKQNPVEFSCHSDGSKLPRFCQAQRIPDERRVGKGDNFWLAVLT